MQGRELLPTPRAKALACSREALLPDTRCMMQQPVNDAAAHTPDHHYNFAGIFHFLGKSLESIDGPCDPRLLMSRCNNYLPKAKGRTDEKSTSIACKQSSSDGPRLAGGHQVPRDLCHIRQGL